MTLLEQIVRLIRDTASSLPEDVLAALKRAARREEKGSSAAVVLKTIVENCALAKKQGLPLCQDTGTLTFFVDASLRRKVTPALLQRAVAEATKRGYLRKNCIDSISGKSYDDNCALGAPVVHYTQPPADLLPPSSFLPLSKPPHFLLPPSSFLPLSKPPKPSITLLLKGGGSENMSRQYSLPDATLKAGRDLQGVRACILDAVQKIQGYGCAPGILGVCIGGDRATGYEVAKAQLLRPLTGDATILPRELKNLESTLLREAKQLGIGPMGLGGKTTLLGVKLAARPRVPASFFVTVAYMCWACRRRTLRMENGKWKMEN